MKRITRSVSLVIGIVLGQVVVAPCAGLGSNAKVEVGAWASYLEYKEPSIMKAVGGLVGLQSSYTYRGPVQDAIKNAMLRGEVRAGFGLLNYDGALQDGTPYSYDGYKALLLELRGLIGYDMASTVGRVTPFCGLGFRRFNTYASGDPLAYDRSSNYFYSPLGIEALFAMNERWRCGGALEYDLFWFGQQSSWVGGPSIDQNQNAGFGLRGSLRLLRKGDRVNLIVEPYIAYWHIEGSEVVLLGDGSGWIEPDNQSTEMGVRVALQF
jgi:hypothetical protein